MRPAGAGREQVARACGTCAKGKRKCSGTFPCERCLRLNLVASCGVLIVFGGCGLCFAHHRFLTGQDGYARLNAWLEEGFLAGDEAVQRGVLTCLARVPLTAALLQSSKVPTTPYPLLPFVVLSSAFFVSGSSMPFR